MLTDQYITVSDLNSYLKTYLEHNYFLQEIFIKGEISNFKRHQSGTFYFAIKDENARVSVVMFPLFAQRVKFPLKDGDMVLIKGKINVHEASGTYSIQASEIIYDSIGMLYVKYEELKSKLENEGLFDQKYKKQLKKYPFKIGVITAPYGAAIHDIVKTIKNRWPIAHIFLFESLVQGPTAANDIVRNLKRADEANMDVIICGRGGGTIEDLWPFNEEVVARAIFNCKTPIISAVGHQSDFTIADFVADVRGLTPTDGAVKACPNKDDVLQFIKQEKQMLINKFNFYINLKKTNLKRLKESYVLVNPLKIYENYRFKIDELESKLENSILKITHQEELKLSNFKLKLKNNITLNLQKKRVNFQKYIVKLDVLSPLKVLNRGYTYVTINNKSVKSINDLHENDILKLDFKDGEVLSKVIERKKRI